MPHGSIENSHSSLLQATEDFKPDVNTLKLQLRQAANSSFHFFYFCLFAKTLAISDASLFPKWWHVKFPFDVSKDETNMIYMLITNYINTETVWDMKNNGRIL